MSNVTEMTEEQEWKRLAEIVASAMIERDKAKADLLAISGLLSHGLKREAELAERAGQSYENQVASCKRYSELVVKLEEMTVSRNTWRSEAKRLKRLKNLK